MLFITRPTANYLDVLRAEAEVLLVTCNSVEAILAKLHASRHWQKAKCVTVFAAHEDASTGLRVEELCRVLSNDPSHKGEIIKQIWLFTELRVPRLCLIAAKEAASADVVIVSMHYAEEVPAELRSWLEAWLRQRSKQPAVLVALFDPVYQGNSSSLRLHLQDAAKRGHLEFLTQAEEMPENRLIS